MAPPRTPTSTALPRASNGALLPHGRQRVKNKARSNRRTGQAAALQTTTPKPSPFDGLPSRASQSSQRRAPQQPAPARGSAAKRSEIELAARPRVGRPQQSQGDDGASTSQPGPSQPAAPRRTPGVVEDPSLSSFFNRAGQDTSFRENQRLADAQSFILPNESNFSEMPLARPVVAIAKATTKWDIRRLEGTLGLPLPSPATKFWAPRSRAGTFVQPGQPEALRRVVQEKRNHKGRSVGRARCQRQAVRSHRHR